MERKQEKQMSEAFCNSVFLALSGGFQDAYTYNTREEVFSNAQTGNVVLMSQHFMMGQWAAGLRYLLPIAAFALGVFIAEQIQYHFRYAKKLHWRQGILLAEILILFLVGFIPTEFNMVATILVSFSCAMQVQTFRKINGYAYASTMCIGNLRSGTAALSVYLREKKPEQLRMSMQYFGIILIFAIGAGIGGN
ncbi:MAG: YoaK family protein, partial [Agathobacter sp.]|nr:YoaK family protein [Agathobacter sp.]